METRDRIVAAGCELLRSSSIRDWHHLTIRAVADRACVNERTVYRHFTNERGLHDAVMQRMEEAAGIDLARLRLEDVAEVATRIVEAVSSHPLAPRRELDPTLASTSERQHDALLRALAPHTAGWADGERTVAAAMLDVLWGVASYERLAVDWGLDRDQAIGGITWVMGLIEDAIRGGRAPGERGRIRPS